MELITAERGYLHRRRDDPKIRHEGRPMRGLRNLLARMLPRRFDKASPLAVAESLRRTSFKEILKRRLMRDSGPFPYPDGGPRIDEVALVAAGLNYLVAAGVVGSLESICPIIGGYTIALNDIMPEGQHRRLLPYYATRLAGTAEEFAVEIRRAEYLAFAAARMFAARALRWTDYRDVAVAWEAAHDLEAVAALRNPTVQIIAARQIHLDGSSPEASAVMGAFSAAEIAPVNPVKTVKRVARAMSAALRAARARGDPQAENEVCCAAFAALDSMLAIGSRAQPNQTI